MIIAVNIGYKHASLGSSVFTKIPLVYECESFKQFAQIIRNGCTSLISFSESQHVPESTICLFIYACDETMEWDFTVKMKDVREYKKLMKQYK